jgi:putative ABC transport system substrate-binding protein
VLKKVLSIFLLLMVCYGSAAAGQEIVAVQSIRVKPYEEAIKAFKSVCPCRIQRLVVSELEGVNVVREIRRIRPDMVLAIGRDALSVVKKIKSVPVVYLMVLNPETILSGEENITGVSMNISPDQQLRALLDALPQTKQIGLVFDPERTGAFVKEARDAAKQMGVTLITTAIHSPRGAPSCIMDMRGKIDVFWMLPDITVMTPETVEFLILFSLKNNIPLLTFSEKYLEMGAFMSTGIDPVDMGVQAGEMANRILRSKGAKPGQQVHARRMVVSTNLMIAGKLGITVNIAGTSGVSMDEKIIRNSLLVN